MQTTCSTCSETATSRAWASAIIWFICMSALLQLLSGITLPSVATGQVLGLGAIFLVGIAASVSSCLALAGGLLLSISAAWSEAHPTHSHWRKLEPLLAFNVGRLAGYFLFGALAGYIGQKIGLSLTLTGIFKILLSGLMIVVGARILHLIPKQYCTLPLPRWMQRRLQQLGQQSTMTSMTLLGALTFFIPCGYTQSMQLLALHSGSAVEGGFIMLFFALGTLPALMGISTLSSYVDGKIGHIFYSFAGTLSIILGLTNLNSGFALAGIDLSAVVPCCHAVATTTNDPHVSIDTNGKQIISVEVRDTGYNAPNFHITSGKETWLYATVPVPLQGCISTLAIPAFNLEQPLSVGTNWIGPFTPTEDFEIMCSMGMFRTKVFVDGNR